MTSVMMPQLGRKLRLLVIHGPSTDMAALAAVLGRSPETLRWWQSGGARRERNLVPDVIVVKLADHVRAVLPDLTEDQARRLVFGKRYEQRAAVWA